METPELNKDPNIHLLRSFYIEPTEVSFDQELRKLSLLGAKCLAAIGVHESLNLAAVTIMPQAIINEARGKGFAICYVKFENDFFYFSQVCRANEVGAIVAQDFVSRCPTFKPVAEALMAHYADGTRMVRPLGNSKLFATRLNSASAIRFHPISWSRATQMASAFVGGKMVSTNGFSPMRYIDTPSIIRAIDGQQQDLEWRELSTPEYAQSGITLGRFVRRHNILGLTDGRMAIVEFEDIGSELISRFSDVIPTETFTGTTIGLLHGENDITVSVQTDEDGSGALITLKHISKLPFSIQKLIAE